MDAKKQLLKEKLANPSALPAAIARESALQARTRKMQARIVAAARTGQPIVAGPWLAEIGFEVLYWIPFLRRLCERHRIPPQQVTVLSRGGVESWYGDIASHYVEILDVVPPDEYRRGRAERVEEAGDQKQMYVAGFDQAILERAGVADRVLAHPLLIYNRLRWYWMGESVRTAERLLKPGALGTADSEPEVTTATPGEYVAVKPYFSECFPDTEANRMIWTRVVHAIAERHQVVLLATGLGLDEHLDHELGDHPDVTRLPALAPARNLAIQTRLIADARLLVSTYGGFSYLGPFLGTPSVGLYSHANFNPVHLDTMYRSLSSLPGRPAFTTLDVRLLGAWGFA